MPTSDYRNAEGQRLPGVTTVIGGSLGWNKHQLMWWAWQQGKDGKDFRETAEKAADAGTLAHLMAHADILGIPFEMPTPVPADGVVRIAEAAFGAYRTWRKQTKLRLVVSEIPMVSEAYRYGGTPDAIAKIGRRHCLIDFKAANGTYPDHLLQLAAYGRLWEENRPEQPLEGGYHLLRFGKEAGDFHHHHYPADALDGAWEAFTHLLALYGLRKPIQALAK